MKARVRTAALAGVALVGGTAAAAEPVVEKGARAAASVTLFDGEGPSDPEPLTLRASAWGQAGLLFENQWEIGAGLGIAAERDHPARDPRGGRFGDCAPVLPGCPALGGGTVRGFVSGATAFGAEADEAGRLSLEEAYLYVRSGWGEASIGRDMGTAQRFSLSPPTVLAIGGGLDPAVDGTGLGAVILRNDISGQSAKATVSSQRILGVQAGLSWTPELEHEGLDQGFRRRAGAPAAFEPEDIVEAGLSFARTFGAWETAAGLTYAQAEDGGGRAAFADMTAWSTGVTVGKGPWSAGASWLQNDNGWAAGGRDYTAWGASGVYRSGDWSWMLEAGASSDDLVSVDVKTVTFAGRKALSDRFSLAGGTAWRELSSPVGGVLSRSGQTDQGLGVFVEFGWTL